MTPTEEIHRLIRVWEADGLTSGELYNQMMEQLWKLPAAERHAALAELSAHGNADIRKAAAEFRIFRRHETLSKDLDYVRQHSPLRPGVRLELFGGYDYYATAGKPWWLNGRDCYNATFLRFAPRGENTIPAALVEFDEDIDVPGHKGRYGVLLASYGLEAAAWGQTEDVVVVYLTEALPEDVSSFRFDRDLPSPIETHATCRIAESP